MNDDVTTGELYRGLVKLEELLHLACRDVAEIKLDQRSHDDSRSRQDRDINALGDKIRAIEVNKADREDVIGLERTLNRLFGRFWKIAGALGTACLAVIGGIIILLIELHTKTGL